MSKSVQENKELYESKIALLRDMLQRELSPAKLTTHTYVGVPSGTGQTKVPLDINGVSIVQYTPYQGDDGCNQIAAVKIWVELKADPVRKRLLNQMHLSA